jgi:hypothetical protein
VRCPTWIPARTPSAAPNFAIQTNMLVDCRHGLRPDSPTDMHALDFVEMLVDNSLSICERSPNPKRSVRPGRNGRETCFQWRCVYRKLDSAIVVMQPAEERMRLDASDPLNRAREGRVLV